MTVTTGSAAEALPVRAGFHAMTEGTRQDWAIIAEVDRRRDPQAVRVRP